MIAELTKNAPLNLGKAKAFAERYPVVTYRSVIAKAKSARLGLRKSRSSRSQGEDRGSDQGANLGRDSQGSRSARA
jgi:hypothetical protein